IGFSISGKLPRSSSISPAAPTPTSVPRVSRNPITKRVRSAGKNASRTTPRTSRARKSGARLSSPENGSAAIAPRASPRPRARGQCGGRGDAEEQRPPAPAHQEQDQDQEPGDRDLHARVREASDLERHGGSPEEPIGSGQGRGRHPGGPARHDPGLVEADEGE